MRKLFFVIKRRFKNKKKLKSFNEKVKHNLIKFESDGHWQSNDLGLVREEEILDLSLRKQA